MSEGGKTAGVTRELPNLRQEPGRGLIAIPEERPQESSHSSVGVPGKGGSAERVWGITGKRGKN